MPNLMEMLLKNLLRTFALHLDFLKVVRLVFWSGVVGPGTNVKLSLARSRSALTVALRAQKLDL